MAPAAAPIKAMSSSARPTKGSTSGAVTACQAVTATSAGMVMVGGKDQPAAVGNLDDRAAVGRLQGGEVEDLGRIAERHLPTVEAQDRVEAVRLLEVVPGDDDSATAGRQPGDQRLELGGTRCVEARERLVEEEER